MVPIQDVAHDYWDDEPPGDPFAAEVLKLDIPIDAAIDSKLKGHEPMKDELSVIIIIPCNLVAACGSSAVFSKSHGFKFGDDCV